MWNRIVGSWKSTLANVLTAVLGLTGVILTAQANPGSFPEYSPILHLLNAHQLGLIALVSGIAKLLMGAVETDPDKTLAKVPGVAAPQMVGAHPVPDDPKAKAVMPMVAFLLLSLTLGMAGCHQPVNTPLPAGALNTFDADSYKSLMVAQASLNAFKRAATPEPVPGYTKTLNKAIADYNVAEAAWQSYHAGNGSSAAVTGAIGIIGVDILAMNGLLGGTAH